MTQRTVGSPTIADKEVRKSRGHWHRESHARHRDYSPTLGRFIERDPIGFEAGDNNWYRFVANGPTGIADPSGLHGWIPGPTVGGVAYPWTPPGTYLPDKPNSMNSGSTLWHC